MVQVGLAPQFSYKLESLLTSESSMICDGIYGTERVDHPARSSTEP